MRIFCSTCKVNRKLCRAPAEHSRTLIPGHVSGRALHEETGQAAVWAKRCLNRKSLGSASLLTSSLTLANENDNITVEALWDPGSESTFFASDLLPFSVDRREQSFKIETLYPSATTTEVVHGVEAAFDVLIPGGETVTLRLLQHTGMELRDLKLKNKLLTYSQSFAERARGTLC